MTISINIPAEIETALRIDGGPSLDERAKQDLAAAWFAEGLITSRQVASLLGISLFEAHAFLKRKGVSLPISLQDVESDLASLRESPNP
jgi:predicted HTH domain antitoxin